MAQTIVVVASTGQEFNLPGIKTVEQVKALYGSDIAGLANMDAAVTEEDGDTVITFTTRSGTKGV